MLQGGYRKVSTLSCAIAARQSSLPPIPQTSTSWHRVDSPEPGNYIAAFVALLKLLGSPHYLMPTRDVAAALPDVDRYLWQS